MSSPCAIRVENLAKRYDLGARQSSSHTLRDALVASAARLNPFAQRNGNKSRSELWALKDLSFEIAPGEVVGFIGRNGAGKSTLLKILARITEPTHGYAEIYGRLGSLLEVGTGFHPELSGRENIYLNGSILGMKRQEIARKFDEIVAFAETAEFLDTPVKHYSSGMYIRLAFAVAAHLEQEILAVDEILAVGDAAFQQKCLGKMTEVAQQGRTILFVSHNTAALLNLCRRGILLERGNLVADGEIKSVIHRYLSSLRAATPQDLASYQTRQGSGRARFTRVSFENYEGQQIERGIAGQPLIIILNYHSEGGQLLPNCRISVTFYDELGQTLFNCSSELTISEPVMLPPSGTIRCVIPRLPLSESQYLLTLFLQVNQEIADWLQNAVELKVVDGDFYGTGRLYPPGWRGKGVLVPHEWNFGDE